MTLEPRYCCKYTITASGGFADDTDSNRRFKSMTLIA
jgi:hypothetical protein